MSTFFAYLLASPVIIGRTLLNKPVLIVLVVACILGITLLRTCYVRDERNVPYYQLDAPTQVESTKVIKTYSRLYYTSPQDYVQEGEVVGQRIFRLSRYYDYQGDDWRLNDRPGNPLIINEKYYGEVKIYDNTNK
jgi:hypothetical protein